MKRFMNKKLLVVGVAVALVIGVGGAAFAYFTTSGTGSGNAYVGTGANLTISQLTPNTQVVYDSLNSPVYPDWWGLSTSTGYTEFGNEINLAPSSTDLRSVVVELDSQACEFGDDNAPADNCTTTPGATFTSVPITLNIYDPGNLTSPIATATQTFTIPYRPSAASIANPGYCATGNNWSGYPNNGTQWYDATNGNCYYGIDYAATFNSFAFTGSQVLPSTVVYGISLTPSGPSDSLNVEESIEPANVTVGSDTDPGHVFLSDSSSGPNGEVTCATVGTTFAQYSTAVDPVSGCGETTSFTEPFKQVWFVPAVQFNTAATGSISLMPGGPGQSVDFSITNNSDSPAYVQYVTVAVASDPSNGLVEATPGETWTDVPGCYASWFTVVQPSSPLDVTIPTGTTLYQPSGGAVSMINEPYSQDACQGITLPLTFTSS